MANMSYCRWENTSNDLHNCLDALEMRDGSVKEFVDDLSEYEQRGFRAVLAMAKKLIEECEDDGYED